MTIAIVESSETTTFIRIVQDGKKGTIKLVSKWDLAQRVKSEFCKVDICTKKLVYHGRVGGWYPVLKQGSKILWIGDALPYRDIGVNSARHHAKQFVRKLLNEVF